MSRVIAGKSHIFPKGTYNIRSRILKEMEVWFMWEEKKKDCLEIISIEEYLYKRKKVKEKEQNMTKREKSSVFVLTENCCGDIL